MDIHKHALLLQSQDEDGDHEQLPKPKKVKRKREPEAPLDPEEALRLKAEAARIAAEVFASAGSAAEAPDEEGETTKASHHLSVLSHVKRI